jgi:hypothetical protein
METPQNILLSANKHANKSQWTPLLFGCCMLCLKWNWTALSLSRREKQSLCGVLQQRLVEIFAGIFFFSIWVYSIFESKMSGDEINVDEVHEECKYFRIRSLLIPHFSGTTETVGQAQEGTRICEHRAKWRFARSLRDTQRRWSRPTAFNWCKLHF